VYDLVGNVQEWTEGLWRDDTPSKKPEDEAWVEDGDTTYRALRGLPLHGAPNTRVQADAAAYREPACATGTCDKRYVPDLDSIGFRCVKSVKSPHTPGPHTTTDAGVPLPAPRDAGAHGVVADARTAAADDCTFESCQANAMEGACCAKKFPPRKQAPPPTVPDEPTGAEIDAAFAKAQPIVQQCADRNRGKVGPHALLLRFGADGHVTSELPGAPNGRFVSCVQSSIGSVTVGPSRNGKEAAGR
jgi:hypothetical protein